MIRMRMSFLKEDVFKKNCEEYDDDDDDDDDDGDDDVLGPN